MKINIRINLTDKLTDISNRPLPLLLLLIKTTQFCQSDVIVLTRPQRNANFDLVHSG